MSGTGLLPDPEARAALRARLGLDGFAAIEPPALGPELLRSLRDDAASRRPHGWGRPSRPSIEHRAWRAEPGEEGLRFLESPEVLGLLNELVGEPVLLSRAGTCYTYYEGPEGHMATHLDRAVDCTYTLIVYLEAEWPGSATPGPGLTLEVWPPGAPPEVDAAPTQHLPTPASTLVVGRGAQVPHRRPRLAEGERLVALTACYAPAVLRRAPPAGPHDPEAAVALTAEGDLHWGRGGCAEARTCYTRALEADPACDQAWSGLGYDYWHQGRFIEAQEAFTRAAAHKGDSASHWANIGLCLRDRGAFDAAVRCLRVALMLDPRYAPALNEWANVLQDQGRVDEAVPLYARSLAIDSSRAVVHHNLGVAYARLGWRRRAESAFRTALARDPAYHHSLEELALLRLEDGDTARARELLERVDSPRARAILASFGHLIIKIPQPCGMR